MKLPRHPPAKFCVGTAHAVHTEARVEDIRPAFLTPATAARFTGYTVKALEVMRSRRKGPKFSKPDGKNVRYRVQDLESWMAAGEVQS